MGNSIGERKNWRFNPQSGKYEYDGGSWTPPPGYVVNPKQPQPPGRDAYYFRDPEEVRDRAKEARVGRHNIRSVEKMLQFFALLGCIAFLLVSYANNSKKAQQAQDVTEIVIE